MTERVLKLKKPIKDHEGNDVTELVFQELGTKDFNDLGYPFVMRNGAQDFVAERLTAYVSRLTGQVPTTIAKLSVPILMDAHMEVMGFFGDTPET